MVEGPSPQARSHKDLDQLIAQHEEQALTMPARLWYERNPHESRANVPTIQQSLSHQPSRNASHVGVEYG